jgi:hypothetical protein
MTLLISFLVLASILSMALAFLAAGDMEKSVQDLEERFHATVEEEERQLEAAAEAARKGDEK